MARKHPCPKHPTSEIYKGGGCKACAREYYRANKNKKIAYQAARYAAFREKGLCGLCGKPAGVRDRFGGTWSMCHQCSSTQIQRSLS
jgi:hypothetical protein